MTDFPRDTLSREAALEKQLEECMIQIANWQIDLKNLPLIFIGGVNSDFEIIQALVRRAKAIELEMNEYLSN